MRERTNCFVSACQDVVENCEECTELTTHNIICSKCNDGFTLTKTHKTCHGKSLDVSYLPSMYYHYNLPNSC